jgi:hypothetical protein
MDPETKSGLLKARADQEAYNFTETQAATTYAGSMAGTQSREDDARTNVSVYSYRSGIDTFKLLREAHGRVSNRITRPD